MPEISQKWTDDALGALRAQLSVEAVTVLISDELADISIYRPDDGWAAHNKDYRYLVPPSARRHHCAGDGHHARGGDQNHAYSV